MMKLSVGDTISYQMWNGKMTTAKVLGIEICKDGEKSGRPVTNCDLSKHRNGILDLDNEHWAYFYQVKRVIKR